MSRDVIVQFPHSGPTRQELRWVIEDYLRGLRDACNALLEET